MEKFYKTSIGYARALKSAGIALLLVMFLSVSVDAVHAQGASAQTGKRRITGTITDADGSPLVGATVYIKDTNVGTTTNTEGLFVIDVLPKQQITISYIGYLSQTLPTDGREVFNIKLQSDTDQLEEVVIVGYGKQKRQAMVSSIATVGSRDLMQSSSSNLTSNLAGQLAGLISIQRSAEPGRDDAEFWIRGISTFKGGTNPLVLVDGIPRDINNIEADEIETFSILKDAAATAVYGAEGANGVILVTTKRGTISRPKISFRIEQSIASPQRLPEFVDSWDYLELANEARSNDGLTPSFSAAQIQLYRDRADNDLYPNTQWIDELVRKAVHSQRYTLNFRGGAENAKYFVSMAYYQSDGVFKENPNGKYDSNFGFERYNLRSNIDLKVSKTTRLSVDLSGQYVHRRTANRSADDIFSFMLHTPSYLFPAIYSDGTLASYEKQADSNNRNPYNMLYNQGYRQEWGVKIQSNIKLEQDLKFITPGLSVRGSVSFDYDGSSATLRDYWPSLYHASGRDAEGNLVFTTTSSGSPEISDPKFTSTSYLRKIYIEGAVNYQRTFNYVHNVSAMLLYMQKEQQKNDPVLPYRKQSVVGRVTYSYDNRYFIEGSFGYTGSETFAKKNRFGFFPAVGVSYFVSNEKFYPEGLKKVMNNLKIRLSMGRTGNDDTGTDRFLYRATFNTEGHTFNQGIGTSASNGMGAGIYDLRFVNNDIHWEIETKRNVGLDLGFFDNEIELTADYFNNRRKDILLERNTVPGVAGFHAKPWQNYGIVDNWGVDASLNARHDFGKVRISARGTVHVRAQQDRRIRRAEPALRLPADHRHAREREHALHRRAPLHRGRLHPHAKSQRNLLLRAASGTSDRRAARNPRPGRHQVRRPEPRRRDRQQRQEARRGTPLQSRNQLRFRPQCRVQRLLRERVLPGHGQLVGAAGVGQQPLLALQLVRGQVQLPHAVPRPLDGRQPAPGCHDAASAQPLQPQRQQGGQHVVAPERQLPALQEPRNRLQPAQDLPPQDPPRRGARLHAGQQPLRLGRHQILGPRAGQPQQRHELSHVAHLHAGTRSQLLIKENEL